MEDIYQARHAKVVMNHLITMDVNFVPKTVADNATLGTTLTIIMFAKLVMMLQLVVY